MHRAFEDDPRTGQLAEGDYAYFLQNFSIISQEYTLLQLAKLHDPAVSLGRINLTLDYVLTYGTWERGDLATLQELKRLLDELHVQIRPARNRLISHNDLESIAKNDPIGAFPAGLDVEYFARLEEFAQIVHERIVGAPFDFSHHAHTDVLVVLKRLCADAE